MSHGNQGRKCRRRRLQISGGKPCSIGGRSKKSPTGVVVHKASTARFDSSTGYKISKVHMWVDANHKASEICISAVLKLNSAPLSFN